MKLSMKWLSDFLDISDINIKDFCEKLTLTGSKVEKYDVELDKINKVVVGRVLSIEKHPDANKLVVCQVDVGAGAPVQIVTGAKNLTANDLVPVALDGSTLPDGTKIKKGKLRGVLSNGMMCSLKELGLTKNDFPYAIEDGIFVLNEQCEIGQNIAEILGINDTIVEFEITPNRPDCLSVIGLAREAAATFNRTLKNHNPVVKATCESDATLEVENLAQNLCKYYSARLIKNVKIGCSPKFIRERLRAMGIKPINNIVDITNYVMMEYGQPMHAFDFSSVDGQKIEIRMAKNGENLTTLDDVERKLSQNDLVIANASAPMAIAGVIGGKSSGISSNTVDVVLESANFDGAAVRSTAKAHNIRTESSSRFEKGLDKYMCRKALDRACELIEMLGIGEVCKTVHSDGVLDENLGKTYINLDCDFINKFLNISLTHDEICMILLKLDCKIVDNAVEIPTFRCDLKSIYDLAEEIARFYGYDKIPETQLKGSSFGHYTNEQIFEKKVKQTLLALGVSEAVTYTFISPKHYEKILISVENALKKSVIISNPLGEDTSVMRATAVCSILDILSKNYNNKNANVKLFEIAKEFIKTEDELPIERQTLVAGFYGDDVDFFSAKGVLEGLLSALNVKNYDVSAICTKSCPYYHPGRAAEFFVGDEKIGIFGEIHPKVLDNYNIKTKVYMFELRMDGLYKNADFDVKFKPIPKFPAVKRDLALVCDEEIPVLDLKKVIEKNAGKTLEAVELFDVYTGEQVGENKKSVAFNITLRSSDSTLSDEQVNSVMKKILAAYEKIGVKIRQ